MSVVCDCTYLGDGITGVSDVGVESINRGASCIG